MFLIFRSTFCHSHACLCCKRIPFQLFFCSHRSSPSNANGYNFPTHHYLYFGDDHPVLNSVLSCCNKQLDCNAASHVKGSCMHCNVAGLQCLSPPLHFSITGCHTTMLPIYSSKIASNALYDTVNTFLMPIISHAATDA